MDTVGFDSYQALLDEVIAQKKFMENGKKNLPTEKTLFSHLVSIHMFQNHMLMKVAE